MGGETGAKARILVVDDSKLMRKAALKMLGDEFDVVTADDGEDAWTLLQSDTTLQVVFTDLNMPRCDGYELLRRVRTAEDPGVQGLPVIVVTGAENDEAARMQALDLGATDFITKPFTTTDLVARARAHAKHQRVTRELQAQAMLDSLTGLANKSGLLDRLQQDIAYARRHQQPLSLVRIEIEDFRRFFLYYGRDIAESLVLQVARLVRARIRKEDTAARIGLGGFALSLPGGHAEGIAGMIERLRAEVSAQGPKDEDGQVIAVVLRAAVLAPDLSTGPSATAVFDQCQELLENGGGSVPTAGARPVPAAVPPTVAAGPSVAPVASVPAETPETASGTVVQPAPPAAETTAPRETATPPAAVAEPLRLDPLFDQLAQGDSQPLLQKLPGVINRLLPLFRLLSTNQRAQLIQFLQKLG
jgi:two-component system cell cycle response regulator